MAEEVARGELRPVRHRRASLHKGGMSEAAVCHVHLQGRAHAQPDHRAIARVEAAQRAHEYHVVGDGQPYKVAEQWHGGWPRRQGQPLLLLDLKEQEEGERKQDKACAYEPSELHFGFISEGDPALPSDDEVFIEKQTGEDA